MSFPKIKVTDKGRALLAQAFTGSKVVFTNFAIGSGECGDESDWPGLTQLISYEKDAEITSFQNEDELATLYGEFTTSTVLNSFWWREIGIYAKIDGDSDENKVLAFYGNAGAYAEYIPAAGSEIAVSHKWETKLLISSTADISAIVSNSSFATTAQLQAHIDNKENPHGVTKAQIGLGNVPNVSTNNQTPTWVETKKLANIRSGELLSAIFSKIAKAIKDLIAHLSNQGNPHAVTAAQAGAAPTSHRATGTTYGMANNVYFGHVKLSDKTDSTAGATDGVAATPAAVKAVADSVGKISAAQKTTAINFAEWANGSFVETLADGSTVTHTVVLDSYGVPVSISGIAISGVS